MKRRTSSVIFLANIIPNDLYYAIRNNIVAKKTNELVLLFHKNITKQVFLWPNMNQKWLKVLNNIGLFYVMLNAFIIIFFLFV